MNIRKASINDLDGIVDISNKMMDFHCSFDPYYCIYREYEDSKEFYKEELQKEDRLFVVAEDENNRIVGFASAAITSIPNTSAPVIGTLISNFVLDDYRKKGIGTAFFNKRMEWLKEHNVKHVEMSVDANNKYALNLWKKFGFKEYYYRLKKDL